MDFICRSVSGRMAARTTTVRAMIETPHCSPTLSWKNVKTASNTSISSWKSWRRRSRCAVWRRARAEQALRLDGIEAAVAERVAAQYAPPGQDEPTQYAVPLDRLDRVLEQLGSYLQRVRTTAR